MFSIIFKTYRFRRFGRYLWCIIKIGGFKFSFPIRFMIAYLLLCELVGLSTGVLIVTSFFKPKFFPTIVTVVLYVYSMVVIIFPPLWPFVVLVLPIWPMVFLLEIAVDILISVRYWFQRRPQINVNNPWKLTTQLKSVNNGYSSDQFYPVTEVDTSFLDDPFWPNASSIFMVEIRRRCLIWRTITIWQVSMFDGGRKKVHVFHDSFQWTDANVFGRDVDKSKDHVKCFKSNGAIFIAWRNRRRQSTKIYVHDQRYQKSDSYKVPAVYSRGRRYPLCIRCVGRHVSNDGSLTGWRIRHFDEMWDGPRAVIESTVLDLRDGKVRLISFGESIIFGNFATSPTYWPIKSADGLFGLFAKEKHLRFGKALMFDPLDGRFDRCFRWSRDEDIGEPHFDHYYALDAPSNGNRKHLLRPSPTVINAHECILACTDGAVFRTQLGVPSSLKYLAANALFRADSNLRRRLTAHQFRQLSGVVNMNGNFDQES